MKKIKNLTLLVLTIHLLTRFIDIYFLKAYLGKIMMIAIIVEFPFWLRLIHILEYVSLHIGLVLTIAYVIGSLVYRKNIT